MIASRRARQQFKARENFFFDHHDNASISAFSSSKWCGSLASASAAADLRGIRVYFPQTLRNLPTRRIPATEGEFVFCPPGRGGGSALGRALLPLVDLIQEKLEVG